MKTTVIVPDGGALSGISARVVRRPALCNILGMSRTATYLKANPSSPYFDPRFPKSVRIGKNSVGWKVDEVLEYINSLPRA